MKGANCMILYFSGTGNSKFVAEKIAKTTNDSVTSLNNLIKENKSIKITDNEKLVFVTPTYGWRIPKIVENKILTFNKSFNNNVYFVMTCGGEIRNAEVYLKKLCVKKGYNYMGCSEIVMPENYIAMFKTPNKNEAVKIIDAALPKIEETANLIKSGSALPATKCNFTGGIYSGAVNKIFYDFFVKDKKFYVTDKCISCGKCVKVCPLNNITLTNKKPFWHSNCTHCMACICSCPAEAIEYGGNSKNQPRYLFPSELS